MSKFDDWKACCAIEGHLDFEALDVALFQPLQELLTWYKNQSAAMQLLITAVMVKRVGPAAASVAKDFLTKLIIRLGFATEATAAVALSQFLVAVAAGAVLGPVLELMSVCMGRVTGI